MCNNYSLFGVHRSDERFTARSSLNTSTIGRLASAISPCHWTIAVPGTITPHYPTPNLRRTLSAFNLERVFLGGGNYTCHVAVTREGTLSRAPC
jgi:hypothetical protein